MYIEYACWISWTEGSGRHVQYVVYTQRLKGQKTYCVTLALIADGTQSTGEYHQPCACTHRNEKVWNQPLVLIPRSPVLGMTSLDVAIRPMRDHDGKEERIKPGKGAVESRDQAPAEREEEIAGVVDFAGVAIWSCSQHAVPIIIVNSGIHQPSARMASPVSVGIVRGFFSCPQGSMGNAFRSASPPRSPCLNLFFWLLVVSHTQYMKRYSAYRIVRAIRFQE